MILISKILFGSAAVATIAGSVVFSDAVRMARDVAGFLQSVNPVETRSRDVHQAQAADDENVQFPYAPNHCPGRCEVWSLLSQIR